MVFVRISLLLLALALLAGTGAGAASTRAGRTPGASDDRSANAATATSDPVRAVPTISSDFSCPSVNGISWTLFREKCYYRYSAPFGVEVTVNQYAEGDYKTWFEAREECAKLGAKLASVHDQATHEKLLQLIVGNETVTSYEETTWIGLQVGAPHNDTYVDPGEGERVVYEPGCYWPADVCPRLKENDPDPNNTVVKCTVTYDDTFHGQWEDGKLYDEAESADFWGPYQPDEVWKRRCIGERFYVDEQSRAYCERGPNGKPDGRQHCAHILPADEKLLVGKSMKPYAGKWRLYWCWMKIRGYVCERSVTRSDGSDYSTAPTFTAGGEETQTTATPSSCGSRLDDCAKRARRRIDEIEREINATRLGYNEVINTMPLGGAAPGAAWLGSASFGHLAQSAIDFGRSLAKLSKEEIWSQLTRTYRFAARTLKGKDAGKRYNRKNMMKWCEKDPPERLIKNITAYFASSAHEHQTSGDPDLTLFSDLVECGPNKTETVQPLMVEVDTIARLALTLLGACADSENVPRSELNESSKNAIQALSKVNDVFKRALRNDTPPCSISTLAPYMEVKEVVASMEQTAKVVLNETKKRELNSKGWSGREKLHQEIVDNTVRALRNNMSSFVFDAIAFLPDDRDDRQCRRFPEDSAVDVGYENLKFFVLYANSSQNETAEEAWEKLKDNKDARDAVLNHVFTESNDDLCGRLDAALRDQGVDAGGFRGVAAVRCGYEFVWYELGYTYFYAAYSSTDYRWEKKGGAYDAKCGQIFFFP